MKAAETATINDVPITTTLQTITPEQAQTWLDHRAPNRSIGRTLTYAMARDMVSGRWQLNHQGIAFDSHGRLVDGQHRLSAIVIAGVPVDMMVTTGLSPTAMATIDDHRPRNGADVLSIHEGSTIGLQDVAILQIIEGLREGSSGRYTKQEVISLWHQHRAAVEFAMGMAITKLKGITVAPVLAVIAQAWYTEDRQRLQEFMHVLRTGIVESAADTAAIKLRDYLKAQGIVMAKRGGQRGDVYRRTQNALRHFLDRRELQVLKPVERDLFVVPDEFRVSSRSVDSVRQQKRFTVVE